jgi:uncharacterized membrane protein
MTVISNQNLLSNSSHCYRLSLQYAHIPYPAGTIGNILIIIGIIVLVIWVVLMVIAAIRRP